MMRFLLLHSLAYPLLFTAEHGAKPAVEVEPENVVRGTWLSWLNMDAVKTILLVEDDSVALTVCQNRLLREGFHVEAAEDGLAAMRTLSAITPNLVILDLMLPKFSGSEVFKFMRLDVRLKNVPVIIFSNSSLSNWPADVSVGPTRSLPKTGTSIENLLEVIQEMMSAAPSPAMITPAATSTATAPMEHSAPDLFRAEPVTTAPEQNPESAANPPAMLDALRDNCLGFIKAPASESGREHLALLHQGIRSLNASAVNSGNSRIAMLTRAMDRQLSELTTRATAATQSVLQTLAQAMDCLRGVLESPDAPAQPTPRARVLAVDDDAICNHVVESALSRTDFEVTTTEDPISALELVQTNVYDIVLLDVNMPKLNGFELCAKLRRLACGQFAAVIFVTAFNSFENRKQSVLSGGEDFIAKPVSAVELNLKITVHLLKTPASRPHRTSEPALVPDTAPCPSENAAAQPALVFTGTSESRTATTDATDPGVAAAAALGLDPEFIVVEPGSENGEVASKTAEIEEKELAPVCAAAAEEALTAPETTASVIPEVPWLQVPPAAEQPAIASAVIEPPAPSLAAPAETSQKDAPSIQDEPSIQNEPLIPFVSSPAQVNALADEPSAEQEPKETSISLMKKDINPAFDKIVVEVARIIFGDENLTDLNLRLVRMALERHHIDQILTGTSAA